MRLLNTWEAWWWWKSYTGLLKHRIGLSFSSIRGGDRVDDRLGLFVADFYTGQQLPRMFSSPVLHTLVVVHHIP